PGSLFRANQQLWGDLGAAAGRPAAGVAGPPRALAALAAARPAARGAGAVYVGGEPRPAAAASGRRAGAAGGGRGTDRRGRVGGVLARQAAQAAAGLSRAAGAAVQRRVRRERSTGVRAVLDAASEAAARVALEQLAAAARGAKLAARLRPHVAAAHVCHRPY